MGNASRGISASSGQILKGEGVGPHYPLTRRREDKLEQMAVRQGWPIPDERKPEIVERLFEIATNAEKYSARQSISAARCLIQMEGQNIALATSPATAGQGTVAVTHEEVLATLAAMHRATCPGPPSPRV